jgi:hypothetical protein
VTVYVLASAGAAPSPVHPKVIAASSKTRRPPARNEINPCIGVLLTDSVFDTSMATAWV